MYNLKEQIGRNIREERIAHGISMEELAEMLAISPAFVGLIERGQRGASIKNLIKISRIFSTSIDFLTKNLSKEFEDLDSCHVSRRKFNTIQSLIYDLNEQELDFLISSIEELKVLNRAIC